MKIRITKTQTTMIALVAAFLIFAGIVTYRNLAMKNQLHQEKIKYETSLVGKLNLEKAIEKFKMDVASLTGENAKLNELLKETSEKLDTKEAEIKMLVTENKSLAGLKKKNQEFEHLRIKLEEEISGLNVNLEKFIAESRQSKEELESIRIKNELLAGHIAILEAMLADNYRIEALKGKNDRLTVIAKRTDKLMVSIDLPSEIGNELTFKIITPGGDEISSVNNKFATMLFNDIDKNYIANLTGTTSGNVNTRRAELVYQPDNKLSKGIYRITLYNGKNYVGSTQVRLK